MPYALTDPDDDLELMPRPAPPGSGARSPGGTALRRAPLPVLELAVAGLPVLAGRRGAGERSGSAMVTGVLPLRWERADLLQQQEVVRVRPRRDDPSVGVEAEVARA